MYEVIQKDIDELKNNHNVYYVILLTHVGMNVEELQVMIFLHI